MQLATATRSGMPWICSVYFVIEEGCFYWLSFPERRHSLELTENANAAIAVVLKTEPPVMGVQTEGIVSQVSSIPEATKVLAKYVAKYGKGSNFIELLQHGKNRHKLYKLKPNRVFLFDEVQKVLPSYREIDLDD